MDRKRKKFNSIIISILFVFIIAAFLILSFAFKDKEFSEIENRYLALKPELTLETVKDGSFTESFEKYIQDQFPFRDNFMLIKSESDVISGKKDNGSVYFGKDGWLFAINEIDENHLKRNIDYINEFTKNLPDSVYTSLIVVPTAASIISDNLPKNATVPDENKAMSIINDNIDSNSADFINITDCLKEKSDDYIYYRTDHHWTTLGAFYAFQFWNQNRINKFGKEDKSIVLRDVKDYEITQISDEFYGTNYSKAMLPSIKPDSMEMFKLKNDNTNYSMKLLDVNGATIKEMNTMYDESCLSVKDKYAYYLSGNNPLVVIQKTNWVNNGKTILVIKDSFSHCFVPFLADEYDRVVVVDLRYYRKEINSLVSAYNVKDVLFLYNIINLSNDNNIVFLNKKINN